MDQNAININVQERLRAAEASIQVMTSLLVSLIETHQDREKLRSIFSHNYETLHGTWLNSRLPDDFLDEASDARRVFDSTFDRPSI